MVLMLTAEYFKERRLERGLSVEEVARKLGCKRLRKAVRRVMAFRQAGDRVGDRRDDPEPPRL